MDKQKNNLSLAFGVPGILLQMGGVCLPGALVGSNVSPNAASLIFLGSLLVGTALLIVGLAFYAMAKGHSPLWSLMGLLGIIGLIVLAALPDRHTYGRRTGPITAHIADTPTVQGPVFQCPQCDYQLNGIPGRACPECGRPFNPDDLSTVKVQGVYTEPTAPWMSRWSLVCGIVALVTLITLFCAPVFGILGAVFGHIARKQCRREGLPGAGVALAGMVTSYTAIGLSVLIAFFAFGLPQIVDAAAP